MITKDGEWFGHVITTDEEYIGTEAMQMNVQSRRKRGLPAKRWK